MTFDKPVDSLLWNTFNFLVKQRHKHLVRESLMALLVFHLLLLWHYYFIGYCVAGWWEQWKVTHPPQSGTWVFRWTRQRNSPAVSTTRISCLLGSKFKLTLFEGCSSSVTANTNLSFQDDLPFAVHCKSFTCYVYKTTILESKICTRWKQAKEIALILNDVSSLVCLSHCIPCSPAWWLPCEHSF